MLSIVTAAFGVGNYCGAKSMKKKGLIITQKVVEPL